MDHTTEDLGFVAVNYISCDSDYRERFESLFKSRAHAIDRLPGFRNMNVLRPEKEGDQYLIVSFWDTKENFESWTKSPEFIEGHKRGFADVKKAVDEGRKPPMTSDFKTYEIITN